MEKRQKRNYRKNKEREREKTLINFAIHMDRVINTAAEKVKFGYKFVSLFACSLSLSNMTLWHHF